jgi:hypothetical protein
MRSGLRYLGVKAARRIDVIDTHTRGPVTAEPILAPFGAASRRGAPIGRTVCIKCNVRTPNRVIDE